MVLPLTLMLILNIVKLGGYVSNAASDAGKFIDYLVTTDTPVSTTLPSALTLPSKTPTTFFMPS
jgi:hypothetical protein